MNIGFKFRFAIISCIAPFLVACSPQSTPTPVDTIGTLAMEIAGVIQTQTAGAISSKLILPDGGVLVST